MSPHTPPSPLGRRVRHPRHGCDARRHRRLPPRACLASDALNVDPDGVSLAEHVVHRTLLPANVLIVEGLANLDRVPAGRVDVVCTPLPYVGRDGSQVRVLVRPQ